MIDREALAAALETVPNPALNWRAPIYEAARERLAQLPEKCDGPWHYGVGRTDTCLLCNGSGRVYPAELVDLVADIIAEIGQLDERAIAILDALNCEHTEWVGRRPKRCVFCKTGTDRMITFHVPGIPKPQGSKRAFVNRYSGKVAMAESAGQPLKDWRGDVKMYAVEAQGDQPALTGPVGVTIVFYLVRPKSHPKTRITYPATRPDIDKLARAVLDALKTVSYGDDGQITALTVRKTWATSSSPAGAAIAIFSTADDE